jgi:hypothetical protein
VLCKAAGMRERLAACLADVRLLPRMRAHVHIRVAGYREGAPELARVTSKASSALEAPI